MAQGLFGLGGMGGMSPGVPSQMAGLYDAEAARKAKLKAVMMNAGLSMLGQGPSQLPINLGTSLGQGLAAGVKAGDQTGKDYKDLAYQTFQINQDQEKQKYGRERDSAEDAWRRNVFEYGMKRDGINDTWNNQRRNRQAQEWEQADAQKAAWRGFIGTLPPDQQQIASMYPDKFAQQFLESEFNTNAAAEKPPVVDTLYDEKTGQPYKAQWNPGTRTWDRVGGVKAPGNGITITNPDGTVTQIGGGGNKQTEGDRRAHLLASQIVGQESAVMNNFEKLRAVNNAAGPNVTGGRAIMSEEGQLATDALKNVVQNWLYLTSGATAPEEEVQRNLSAVTPSPFDGDKVVQAKKARLKMMIDSMKQRAGIATETPAAASGMPDFSTMTDEELEALANGQ